MKTPQEINQSIIIEGHMLQYCGPIFFLRSAAAKPTDVFRNGTFGLLDTGERKLLVTCAHVWNEFTIERRKSPTVQLAVLLGTNKPISLPEPIAVNTEVDLATFDMEPLLPECGRRRFYRSSELPVPPVRPKDILGLLGYVGRGRQNSPEGANFRYEFVGTHVADVSSSFICVDLSKTRRFRDPDGRGIRKPKSMGGLSGSPAYRIMNGGVLKMVGFVTSSAMGILRISHVNCVGKDGSISCIRQP